MKTAPHSPAQGLRSHDFIKRCRAVVSYTDYVKLVIKLKSPLQTSQLRAKFPAGWSRANLEVTPAGKDIPGAMNPTSNSTNFYTLTVHEPHLHPFDVSLLPAYLDAINGQLSLEHCQVEFGLDFIPSKEIDAYKNKAGSFLLRLVSHFKHQQALGLTSSRVFCPYPIGMVPTKKRTAWVKEHNTGYTETITKNGQRPKDSCANMGTHIQHTMHRSGPGCTFYMGNNSGSINAKVNGVPTRIWQRSTELRAYFKTRDRGSDLPADQQRFRAEFVAPCISPNSSDFDLDPIKVLAGASDAACVMAKFFALVLPSHALLSTIRQYRGISQASDKPEDVLLIDGQETTRAKLHNKFKRCGKAGVTTARIGADAGWNQYITGKFTCMAAKMKCATFTFESAAKATPTVPAPCSEVKTGTACPTGPASEWKEQKVGKQIAAKVAALSPSAALTGTPATPKALITVPTTSPQGDGRYILSDEELMRMLNEME